MRKLIPENADPHVQRETSRLTRGIKAAEEMVSVGVERVTDIGTTVV
jgi:hypothetical protein